jgi:hypothetical protein
MNVPNSPDTITAAYLEPLLRHYLGEPGLELSGFSVERLNRGTSGAQLHVVSVILAPDKPPMRFILKMNGGQKEVFFYRDLASSVPVDTPGVLDARLLEDGRAWVLMEEITGAKDGLAWDEADHKAVLSDMARLHAQYWGRADLLDDNPWLWRPDDSSLAALAAARRRDLEAIASSWLPEAVPTVFGADRLSLARQVLDRPQEVFGPLLAAGTSLVHGDYWFHNVQVTGTGRRALVDWQDPQIWSGIWELAYFLNLLLVLGPREYREELPFDEDLLIKWYLDAVAEAGVDLPRKVFDEALLSARVWHPLQHWVQQFAYIVTYDLLPTRNIQEANPGAVTFLTATFTRWEQDAWALLGV